jgi:putative copper resistance protein D
MKLGPSVFPLFRYLSAVRFLLLAIVAVSLTASPMFSQVPAEHQHHDHAGMAMDEPITPAQQAKLLADKRESEFNHHLAGFFLVLAGILIFGEPLFRDRALIARYAWPVCFLLSGLFVLIFSDTELWPFGPKSWLQGMLTNHEVMQHKTFAVLLLALGTIELARARNKLTAAWSAWVFPVFAFVGSILLLFHSHDAGMHGPDHMATMQRIQAQHFSYSGTGLGIGLAKGLSEVPNKWQSIFARLYPALMIVLGVLLMIYVE